MTATNSATPAGEQAAPLVASPEHTRTLRELLVCCEAWEPDARVMGNVRSGDAADAIRAILATTAAVREPETALGNPAAPQTSVPTAAPFSEPRSFAEGELPARAGDASALLRVGLFSRGADGVLCFHEGNTDAQSLADSLTDGVTGGPYAALGAFAGPVEASASLYVCRECDWHGFTPSGCPRCAAEVDVDVHGETTALASPPAAPLQAEPHPDTRDALRYRWLRDKSADQWEHPIVCSQSRTEDRMLYVGPLTGDVLDAAIDAARAAIGQAQGERG